jgi:hypothetical protein
MLAWGELQEQAAQLEAEIKAAALEIGKTVTNGNVRATYSNPRKTYQSWDDSVMEAEPDGLDPKVYEVVTVTTDWQKAATDYKIERKAWVDETAKPSVTLKLQ